MDISIQDLAAVVQIIDLAASRGAFQGNELLPVGTVRENLARAVKKAQEQQPEPETDKA